MKTRGVDATGPVPVASVTTARQLRPRQARRAQERLVGSTVARPGGRATRSSVAAQTSQTPATDAVGPVASLGASRRSHKRSQSQGANAASRRPKRTRRSRHLPGFYGEDSDSGDEPDNPYITPGSDVEQEASTRKRTSRSTASPRKSSSSRRPNTPPRPRQLSAQQAESKTQIDDAVVPNWASLPYHVLVQIFRYAASPLSDSPQVKWLTAAASGICRAFAEPAVTALYESPPLLSRAMAHGLVSLLARDPSTTLWNYRRKVEELCIDVEDIASKTYKGQPLDLVSLVGSLPRLKYLQFFHLKDGPPYRSLDENLRWHYPAALFHALNGLGGPAAEAGNADHPRLEGWQWNRRLMGDLDLAGVKALHETPAFLGLKKVSFVNYQVPSLHAKANDDDAELAARDLACVQSIADAICALKNLEHLSIESSTAANDQLLPLLPRNLATLELVNCWDISGDDLSSYLLSSGSKLKRLILRHNQSLDLSFLTVLGTACPNLQTLYMDFKTFKHHEFYRDSDPMYDELFAAKQTPDWPEMLETLQLLNMKKWTAEAAETLFQSLVDSAPRLLHLRRLDLKAMLSIPIQRRAQLRNKWAAKLKQVFLREQEDPRPFVSLRQPAEQVKADAGKKSFSRKSRTSGRALAAQVLSRRSTRLAMQLLNSNPSSRASSVGRDLRSGLGRPSYAEPDTDTDEEEDGDDGEEGDGDGQEDGDGDEHDGSRQSAERASQARAPEDTVIPFRHSMCDEVEIQLDNQKTAETTLTWDDFLDSERDDLSDQDWDGEDEDFDTGYAWS